MDLNQSWGWKPPKGGAPSSGAYAPLGNFSADAPANLLLPESKASQATRQAGAGVVNEGLNQLLKPDAITGSATQDSATKAALYGAEGYGEAMAPMGADAAAVAAEGATEAAAEGAAESLGDAALSGASEWIPYAGVLKSLAEGEYAQAAAKAAGTTFFGPMGGAAAGAAAKWIGLEDGTASVSGYADGTAGVPAQGGKAGSPTASATPTMSTPASRRMAAGARFAPELFAPKAATTPAPAYGSVPAVGGKGGSTPAPAPTMAIPTPASRGFITSPALSTQKAVAPLSAPSNGSMSYYESMSDYDQQRQ